MSIRRHFLILVHQFESLLLLEDILTGMSLLMDPLSLRTSLARKYHIRPRLLGLLLLQGTAISMNLVGESTLQKAIMGTLAYDPSVTGYKNHK